MMYTRVMILAVLTELTRHGCGLPVKVRNNTVVQSADACFWPQITENQYCAPCNGGDAASCDFSEKPAGSTGCCEGLVCKWAGDNPTAGKSLYTAICMSSSGPTPGPSPSPSPSPSPGPSPSPSLASYASPAQLAKAWSKANDGAYAADCANAMAISFGEGVVRKYASPLHYIFKKGSTTECEESPCWPNAKSLHDFIHSSDVFDLDLPADDNPNTVGPWQTTTVHMHGATAEMRVAEAIGYLQSCCMDGDVSVPDLPLGDEDKWCKIATTHGDCPNTVDGKCNNPNRPGEAYYPVTTIFKSELSPALTWCGCATNISPNENHATTGYSGRCNAQAKVGEHFYSRYLPIAEEACRA